MTAFQLVPTKTILTNIRDYRSSDLDTLVAIDQACFIPRIAYTRDELAGFISQRNARTWVAETEEEIVGFVVCERPAKQTAHIITIDVVEAWRRRGVGAQLMNAVEVWAYAQNLRVIYLETAENNVTAQRFYQKRGYVRIEKLKDYYAGGLDAWLMAKRL